MYVQHPFRHLFVDPYKGIRIPESEKLLHVESVIQPQGIQTPSSSDKESGIQCVGARIQDCIGFPTKGELCLVHLKMGYFPLLFSIVQVLTIQGA